LNKWVNLRAKNEPEPITFWQDDYEIKLLIKMIRESHRFMRPKDYDIDLPDAFARIDQSRGQFSVVDGVFGFVVMPKKTETITPEPNPKLMYYVAKRLGLRNRHTFVIYWNVASPSILGDETIKVMRLWRFDLSSNRYELDHSDDSPHQGEYHISPYDRYVKIDAKE
jgi:hypothetical protein